MLSFGATCIEGEGNGPWARERGASAPLLPPPPSPSVPPPSGLSEPPIPHRGRPLGLKFINYNRNSDRNTISEMNNASRKKNECFEKRAAIQIMGSDEASPRLVI